MRRDRPRVRSGAELDRRREGPTFPCPGGRSPRIGSLSLYLPTLKILQSHRKQPGTSAPKRSPPVGQEPLDHRLASSLAVRDRRQSQSPSSARCNTLLTCVGFRVATGRSFWQVAGLQALQGDFRRSQHGFDLGNVELRGFDPLTSCMPCNSSDFLTWGSMAPTWAYRARKCLRVPVSLSGMAVHLAVRIL